MRRSQTLPAFTEIEYQNAHTLLASQVAGMMGRKLEEGDWTSVYCRAKGIPNRGWSNLDIDVVHGGLGVEHKMLCVKSDKPIKTECGTSPMHPSATRSIRIPDIEDATLAAREVLRQYAELINVRTQKVKEDAPGVEPDMRVGWLLWQESLVEFLYFEQEMIPPNPEDYWAEWHESGGKGARKKSTNLWVYENETGNKRYSITTSAGAKIQPYFDVPAPNDPNLYYFRVQGEELANGIIRVWITGSTALLIKQKLGSIETDVVSQEIIKATKALALGAHVGEERQTYSVVSAQPILLTQEAYLSLSTTFDGVSDEHRMELFAHYLLAPK